MFAGYGNDPMPSDKLMKLFIIQAISSFVANDYETGVHYLREIKQTYAEHMARLNPTLKNLAKEIIQAVDLFNPDSGDAFIGASMSSTGNEPSGSSGEGPAMPNFDYGEEDTQQPAKAAEEPRSVASELQELLRKRRERRNK